MVNMFDKEGKPILVGVENLRVREEIEILSPQSFRVRLLKVINRVTRLKCDKLPVYIYCKDLH